VTKADFLALVVQRIPQGFMTEAFRRTSLAIADARASVRNDPGLDPQEWVAIEGQLRYARVFKQLRDSAEAVGVLCDDYATTRGSFVYPVVTCKPFVLTVSAIPAVGELPVASEYRTNLAEALNAAWTTPKLRDVKHQPLTEKPLYGIIIYTVPRIEGIAGFLGIGFPNDDYTEWLAVLSATELTAGYDSAREAATDETVDRVHPTIRRRRKDGDAE
jgi:hypothetical protein